MSKLKNCSTCGKEIAKSAKICPHCGAKVKSGILFRLFKLFVLIVVISLLIVGYVSSQTEGVKKVENLALMSSTHSFPSKELDDLFYSGTDRLTNIQVEQEISKLKSGVIQGKIRVYDVVEENQKVFRVMAFDMQQMFYTTVIFHAQSVKDAERIKNLKRGDIASFKGKVESVNLFRGNMGEGKLVIDPAIIL